MCDYGIAWVGKCKADGEPYCGKHAAEKCVSCKEQATRECDETGQFVCGAPLCANCEHTIAENGTNGGVGFYRVSPLPPAMNEHCRKDAQVYTPWFTRCPKCGHQLVDGECKMNMPYQGCGYTL